MKTDIVASFQDTPVISTLQIHYKVHAMKKQEKKEIRGFQLKNKSMAMAMTWNISQFVCAELQSGHVI